MQLKKYKYHDDRYRLQTPDSQSVKMPVEKQINLRWCSVGYETVEIQNWHMRCRRQGRQFCRIGFKTIGLIMRENFRPIALSTSIGLLGKFKFSCRIALDLQVASVYRSIRSLAQGFTGTILDVGCGASPYKFLFDSYKTKYVGIDIVEADHFDYRNSDVISFNGKDIPFSENTFDGVICTEVLEHVYEYQALVDEIHRVMKPGATLMLTVPWSARYHYIPYDFFRYTPSTLKLIFKDFKELKIIGRGTDITSIVAKILVIWFRNLLPTKGSFNIVTLLLAFLFTPFVLPLACLGHLSMRFKLGSDQDPLGYSVIATK